ncbi:MAG: TerB family tellurite resistance protein [Candidatus Hydrogenedentes bacterium]|nr:TerB family tellurite resistance protein [Candidatus Hydrogenedentota bacterium]
MLSRIVSLFAPAADTSQETHAERLRLATCVLLLEVAGADNEFSPGECEHIVTTLKKRFSLSQEDAEELLNTAEARRAESFDLWKFTNTVNAACNNDEKQEILREVWRVIFADGNLDGHEDYMIHKLAKLMNLTHPQLIKAKLAVREEISAK